MKELPKMGAGTMALWKPEWGRCSVAPHKRRYPCRGKARRAARLMGGPGSVYKCDDCGDYHLTSQPARVAAAIRYLLESLRDDRKRKA